MYIEEGMLVKATHDDGKTFTGTVYKIVVQPCKDDNNRPHALIFISQDKRFIEQEGEFGCVSEWVDKLQSIEVLEKSKDTSERDALIIDFDDMLKEYPQTPTSDFFEEVLNGTDYPNEKKVLYISKFDEEGNWAAFNCAYDGEENHIVYGGHIGLCSATGESYLTVYNLLYWLERFRSAGVKVIVDVDWYLSLPRQ